MKCTSFYEAMTKHAVKKVKYDNKARQSEIENE